MAKKETYNLVKDYHHSVRDMHEKAESFENHVLKLTRQVLDDSAFVNNFSAKKPEEYNELEVAILTYMNEILNSISNSELKSSYDEVLKKYTVVLNELAKD